MKKYCITLAMVMVQTIYGSNVIYRIGDTDVSPECWKQFNSKLQEICSNNYAGESHESLSNRLYNLSYQLAREELQRVNQENPNRFLNNHAEENIFHQKLTVSMCDNFRRRI